MATRKPKQKIEADVKVCSNCEFFNDLGEQNVGECFRFPPIPQLDDEQGGIQSIRPIIFTDERVCGEFKRKLDS